MAKHKWNEDTIARRIKQGYGAGHGENYKPWIGVEDLSSRGRSRRAASPRLGRTVDLLSDGEYKCFLVLERAKHVHDIRENFPLDRDLTQQLALQLGIKHPIYPGTCVPAVMTVDFLVDLTVDGVKRLCAVNVKHEEEASDPRSIEKLEIQREYFEQLEIPHHLIFPSRISDTLYANLDRVRSARNGLTDLEPRPGYFDEAATRLAAKLARVRSDDPIADLCAAVDVEGGYERGTGIRAMYLLLSDGAIATDLDVQSLVDVPCNAFAVRGQADRAWSMAA